MNLENLVPTLDLCKQIPAGHFEDSALVWSYSCDKRKTEPFVEERDCIDFCRRDMINTPPVYPAPTLAEILLALSESGNAYTSKNEVGCVVLHEIPGDEEGYGYSMRTETDKDNYATAALKLWLDLSVKEKNA